MYNIPNEGKSYQNSQMVCHVKEEEGVNRNIPIDMDAFKPRIKNITKCQKIRQKTYEEIQNGKTVETIL